MCGKVGGFGWESVWKGGSFWGCEVGFSQRRKWDVVRWSGSWVQKGFGGYRVSRAGGGGLLLLKGGFWAWKCVEEGLVLGGSERFGFHSGGSGSKISVGSCAKPY